MAVDRERVAALVRELLEAIGEDPDRPGLRLTPGRVADAYAEFFSGVGEDAAAPLAHTISVARGPAPETLAVRRRDAARHPLPLRVRAPPAALPRARAHRVPAGRAGRRARGAAEGRRRPRLAPAGAGAPRRADRRRDRGLARHPRRARRARRGPRVRDDAQRSAGGCIDRHDRRARRARRTRRPRRAHRPDRERVAHDRRSSWGSST